MNSSGKIGMAWALLFQIRQERKAPLYNLNDDIVSNLLFHAMKVIEDADRELTKEMKLK